MSEVEMMKKCCGKWILDTVKTNEIYNYFLQFLGNKLKTWSTLPGLL